MKNVFRNLGNNKFNFQVIVPDNEKMVCFNISVLKKHKIKIEDLRQACILDKDGSSIRNVYVLVCKGTRKSYEKIKNLFCLDEITYEGLKTLI